MTCFTRWLGLACVMLLPICSGCALLGYAASALPKPEEEARYKGLAGQRVAVVVWTDRATRFDYATMGSDVQLDTAKTIVSRLKQAQPKVEELKDAVIIEARQADQWIRNHPEMEGRTLVEMAPRLAAALGATRIIHVEIPEFMTHDPRNEILLRGFARFNVRVAEITGGAARQAYEEAGITANFPEKAPEGVPATDTVDQEYIYRGLRDEIATQSAVRFFSYRPE